MTKDLIVIYVEDEPDIRSVTELALEDEGFVLHSFSEGSVALEKAEEIEADLILLDVMMPHLDGPETLRRLRKIPHLEDVPAIFMTAKVQDEEIDKLLDLGAVGVIKKPFDPMSLESEVKALLRSVE